MVGGVETEEQLNFLQSNRCLGVQGYYSSQPLTAEQMTQFIEDRNSKKAVASCRFILIKK